MSVIEKAVSSYREKMSQGLQSIEVPEWGSTIYYGALTLSDQEKINKYASTGSIHTIVETLIVRARDEEGKKLFAATDRTQLNESVDLEVLQDIVKAMNKKSEGSIEEAKKP